MMLVDELPEMPEEQWGTTAVAAVMRTDFPTAHVHWRLQDALRAMEIADVDLLVVLDGGAFVGTVTSAEILKLDDILQITGDEDS